METRLGEFLQFNLDYIFGLKETPGFGADVDWLGSHGSERERDYVNDFLDTPITPL